MANPYEFDEEWYLAYNLDVAQAGVDAYSHWINNGLSEGRSVRQFTEAVYLQSHSDVADAVARGDFASGWEHYILFGASEGRLPFGSYHGQGAATDDNLSLDWVSSRNTGELKGYEGNDTLTGGDSDDLIYGNQGIDLLNGGIGSDTIYGGQNAGPAGADGVLRSGVETISGGGGNDLIYGNHGGDYIVVGSGSSTVYGGQDDDTIDVEGGISPTSALFFGNRGDDRFVFDDQVYPVSNVTVVGGEGADTLSSTPGLYEHKIVFSDFNPEEGDRIEIGFTPVSVTQSGTEVRFDSAEFYTRYPRYVVVDINRTDFSDDWWF
ncbi:calcium-binding protein [Thalassobaculum sp. OXR-137]|uniref:calcium-binding protein n=1 Tax=Thalassobaculum sp. OXR-137 TaxID=3100173 RepID=UPI002AC9CDDD|nr:calcium-binding protein [Thalassobaculum sp. OXR-137]WPZ36223.1 calcium-binding protein [Thalassobaculum sp. OXR-137]